MKGLTKIFTKKMNFDKGSSEVTSTESKNFENIHEITLSRKTSSLLEQDGKKTKSRQPEFVEDPKRKKSEEPENDKKKSAAQKIGDGIRKWIKKDPKDQKENKEIKTGILSCLCTF